MTFRSSCTAGVALPALMIATMLAGCSSSKTNSSDGSSISRSSRASSATSRGTTTCASSAATAPAATIAAYLAANNVQQTIVHHGDPGAPNIDLPIPRGWTQLPEQDGAPYGLIAWQGAADPKDPPTIRAALAKLDGNVDTDQILAHAPAELENHPGYSGNDGQKSQLSGFPAYQLDGTQPSASPEWHSPWRSRP